MENRIDTYAALMVQNDISRALDNHAETTEEVKEEDYFEPSNDPVSRGGRKEKMLVKKVTRVMKKEDVTVREVTRIPQHGFSYMITADGIVTTVMEGEEAVFEHEQVTQVTRSGNVYPHHGHYWAYRPGVWEATIKEAAETPKATASA